MKNIVTIISALLLISGSVFLDMFLSEGNLVVPVETSQYVYEPLSNHLRNDKTESLPFEKCNSEKEVEGAHAENARFGSVRKIFSRHTCFAPLSILNKHSITALLIPIKVKRNYPDYTVNNLPLHVRNCIWLI